MSNEWQPIESAPFETRIILWCEDNRDRKNASGVVFGRVVDFTNGERKDLRRGHDGRLEFYPLDAAARPTPLERTLPPGREAICP